MDTCKDFGFHLQLSLFSRMTGIEPRQVHVEIVVKKVTLGHVSLGVLRLCPATIIYHYCSIFIHSSIIDHGYIILLRG